MKTTLLLLMILTMQTVMTAAMVFVAVDTPEIEISEPLTPVLDQCRSSLKAIDAMSLELNQMAEDILSIQLHQARNEPMPDKTIRYGSVDILPTSKDGGIP